TAHKLVESQVAASGAATVTLEFDNIPCSLELANQATGPWREGLAIVFERGSLTIELPPPFAAGTEARVILDDGRGTNELARGDSWGFRRQANAFAADIAQGNTPIASGEDSGMALH